MRLGVLSLVVLTVGFAPAPFPRAERRAPARLDIEGYWEDSTTKLHVTRTRFTYDADYDYELTLDPTARPPTFDLRGIGRKNAGWEYRGIYKVEGGRLTIC